MSYNIANYTFLPWLRQGIANKIDTADNDAGVKVRAKIKVDFKLQLEKVDGSSASEPFTKDVELYGPGDIIGIDPKVVIKNEPHNWITNFEPNYLPYVEFYEESFPWRYTPARPGDDRLRPWIALVVVKEGEFEEAKNIQGKPLSYITVPNADTKFPPADQLWAWAHVHVSESLMDQDTKIVEADTNKIATAFQAVMNKNPDLASSRILCPIKLESNTAYHAFLIPTFETGRLAGLGLDPAAPAMPHATFSAWGNYGDKPEPENFPVYHRWFFRTGDVGDFEYLVRLLKPQPIDKRVGRRDIDVMNPGSNIDGITNPDLHGILKLGGALKVPFMTMTPEDQAEVTRYDTWDQVGYPQPFQQDLAQFINLADDYSDKPADEANAATDLHPDIQTNKDPMITPPLYGRWHATTDRLLTKRDGTDAAFNRNWVHQLNLDPRWRVAAGYGTKVVQDNQENYMEAAWEQVGDVLEGNRKLRYSHFARLVSLSWYHKHLGTMRSYSPEKSLLLMAPVQRRVLDTQAGVTVHHHVAQSVITQSVTSPSMRKVIRPGGRVMKKSIFEGAATKDNLITRINDGEIVIAPPKVISPELPTVDQVAEGATPTNVPPFILDLIRRFPWLKWALIIAIAFFLLLIFLFSGIVFIASVLGVIAAALMTVLGLVMKWEKAVKYADSIAEENQTPESIDSWPNSPDFVLSEPGGGVTPATGGSTDSAEARKFKLALRESLGVIQTAKNLGKVVPRPKINIAVVANTTFEAINPAITIPKLIFSGLHIPDRIRTILIENFAEIMEYPKIDVPMYEPLKKLSKENFLPNLNFIAQNSISLMETNQKFIESYMVGLNHEFSRELLWREYPTDQMGSYFRQFWDVDAYFDDKNRTDEKLKEDLKDIPPIHKWSLNSDLGDHDNREEAGDKEEEVVLVIRGELLKKYPNAVIYAQKASWVLNDNGTINNKVERVLVELTPAEQSKPPRNKFKTPLYEARVEPDLYFFGFDLTVLEALGESGENASDIDKPGWFFCIKERPGEPRFGLDIDQDPEKPENWNDLAWTDVLPANAPAGSFIPVGNATIEQDLRAVANLPEPEDGEKLEQRADDLQVFWKKSMNAADVAYILYQVPVLMAVHAGEMLPKPQEP